MNLCTGPTWGPLVIPYGNIMVVPVGRDALGTTPCATSIGSLLISYVVRGRVNVEDITDCIVHEDSRGSWIVFVARIVDGVINGHLRATRIVPTGYFFVKCGIGTAVGCALRVVEVGYSPICCDICTHICK